MTPDLIAQVSTWLAATDIGFLELRGPGVGLRLIHRDGHVEPAPVGYEPRAARPAVTLHAPSVGRVRLTHPLHTHLLAAVGQAVAGGQAVLLLEIGSLLLPVVAPMSGTMSALRVAEGDVVGYGSPLVDLVPSPTVCDDRVKPEGR
jgi:acetyl-CoA carboxylase biotin carboxyl carrier protein